MDRQYSFREGMTVFGADGEKVGKVVAVDPAFIVVEKGFFFPTDYYIPTSAIANSTEDDIYLTVSKDEALNQGWDQPYAADGTIGTGAATGTTEAFADQPTATTDAYGTPATGTGDMFDRPFDRTAAGRVETRESDRVRVPVHEEELQAVTRERDRGAVRIEKDVIEEDRVVDVPLTEERVRVRQVAASGEATADPTAFEEGVIEVPIRGEEVELRKTARQTGAVEVDKEAVQRTERVAGKVRKEQVRVDKGTADVDYVDDTTVTDR
jgi:uncharacterized protein (TIGR02271 family)